MSELSTGRTHPILGILAMLAGAAATIVAVVGIRILRPESPRRSLPSEYLLLPAPPPRMAGQYPCVYQSLADGSTRPQLGECATPTLSPLPVDRLEVDLRYGNFVVRQTDLILSDTMVAPFTRTYNSGDWVHPNLVHAFGRNTNHPYDIAPLGARNPYTWLEIVLEDGNFVYMDRISNGTDYADAVFRHTETSGKFYRAMTYWNGDGWTTRLEDGSLILFPDSYSAKKMADGAPYEIDDAAGNKLLLKRDGNRNLHEIRTPRGHTISLDYDGQGRIRQAQDDDGNSVSYQYGPGSTLVAVKASSGAERYYEYEQELITAVRDEHRNLLVRNRYDHGKLVVQQFPDGEVFRYDYHWAPAGTYTESVVVQSSNGREETTETGIFVPDSFKRQH